ncbi:uncharacterized protein LOC120990192 isoform X1 [Bufo bufo]|uniref:uncharacterized protein LOC120990192 isoform X1 n=1 Tax=Bufo bufo TaxID=8384 RepID=UPI001ABEAE7D|nr:uncharacterized protein LOC120990192 isoform X1 [Bufo bufo]
MDELDQAPRDDHDIFLTMQNVKEEPVDAGAVSGRSQEQYYSYLEDTDFKQENAPELEGGVDGEIRIVSIESAKEANNWVDHDVKSLLSVWSDDRIPHQLKEADENFVGGSEAQVFALRNKRRGCQNDHQVPSKKPISADIRSRVPVELSSGIHVSEEVGGIQEVQNFIDQHSVCFKDQSEHHRYKPQMSHLPTRLTGDSILHRLSKRGHPSSGRLRKVCKNIICLPAEYPEDYCTYRVPRGTEREQLAMLGLVGKILIHSSWNFENFRTEVITLFRKCFSCSDEEFSFDFLQCLPGNRKLIKPNVSATFKWSGVAIISLAAQGSLYVKTPHTLAAPAKNMFFNTKRRLPDAESENIASDRQIAEISQPGVSPLIHSVDEKEDSQHCTVKDLRVPQHQTLAQDHTDETASNTGQRPTENPYQGITKEMCEVPQHSGSLLTESTDEISTGNTATKYYAEGKSFNMTNNFVFKLLRDAGIKTALLRKVSENRFVTCGCEIIPITWGCWRIATGMYLKRHPDAEGSRLYPPRVEMFYKDDVHGDVVCSTKQLLASKMNSAGLSIGQSEIDIINHSVVAMFEILEKACLAADFILVNMKVQFGVDLDNKEIVLADVIEYNCWHQSQLEDKGQQDDKQHPLSQRGQGRVVVLMESTSYLVHCEQIKASCAKYNIPCELRVSSAYSGPGETLDIKSQYEGDGTPTVFITVAGRSTGLASVLSANTAYPVINCPAVTADWRAQDMWSALSVPENLGFCTVLSPQAAAQFSAHILGLSSHQLWSKLRSCTLNKWISVKQEDEKLRDSSM